jgi:hypothetical protein
MPGISIPDWLLEQEQKRKPFIFFLEWVFTFTMAWFFWTAIFSELQGNYPSAVAVAAVSAFYGSALVYLRLLKVTGCKKCNSFLPLLSNEIQRRHVRNEERMHEVEYGGEAWMEHLVHLYVRLYHVDIVKFRCRKCHAVWQETEQLPASDYKLVRTIDMNK